MEYVELKFVKLLKINWNNCLFNLQNFFCAAKYQSKKLST